MGLGTQPPLPAQQEACLMEHEGPSGRRPCLTGAGEPVSESGPDVDTNPEWLPPAVGEHVEQSVLPFDAPRRQASKGGAPWTRCIPK